MRSLNEWIIVVFLQNSLFHDDFDAESDNVASSAETMRARAAYISAVSTSKVIEALSGLFYPSTQTGLGQVKWQGLFV